MPHKAKSRKQFRYLQAAAHGKLRGKGGPSPATAKEMLGGQSPKGLPESAAATAIKAEMRKRRRKR